MPAPITVDTVGTTPCGEKFKTIAKHRSSTSSSISKWTITINEEFKCFIDSLSYCIENAHIIFYTPDNNTIRWGIILNANNKLRQLGRNNLSSQLFFAKFTKHTHNQEWHGYPSDYINKVQDNPNKKFLKSLCDNSILTKSQFKKITQGKSCGF